MRVVAHPIRGVGDADRVEQLHRPAFRLAARRALVHEQRFGDLVTDREDRIERRHGLLENERDLCATHGAHVGFRQREQVAVLEPDHAAGDPARRLDETHDRERGDRFAASGFSTSPGFRADPAEASSSTAPSVQRVDRNGRDG